MSSTDIYPFLSNIVSSVEFLIQDKCFE